MNAGDGAKRHPERFGPYRVLDVMGRGGMGVVYLARDENLDRTVAIKVLGENLCDDLQFVRRFQREARAAAALSHPNVIPIYFVGLEGGRPYFVMEYLPGGGLDVVIRRAGRIDTRTALRWVLDASSGLAAAHDQGLIHRDIKPANLLLDARQRVKIVDFGVATGRADETRLTSTGHVLGSPGYFSPEQCRGEPLDPRTDIYSLGVTLYQLLAGRLPFAGDSPAALVLDIVQAEPPPIEALNEDVDPAVAALLRSWMAKDREARPANCHQAAASVEQLLGHGATASETREVATVGVWGGSGEGRRTLASQETEVVAASPGATSDVFRDAARSATTAIGTSAVEAPRILWRGIARSPRMLAAVVTLVVFIAAVALALRGNGRGGEEPLVEIQNPEAAEQRVESEPPEITAALPGLPAATHGPAPPVATVRGDVALIAVGEAPRLAAILRQQRLRVSVVESLAAVRGADPSQWPRLAVSLDLVTQRSAGSAYDVTVSFCDVTGTVLILAVASMEPILTETADARSPSCAAAESTVVSSLGRKVLQIVRDNDTAR